MFGTQVQEYLFKTLVDPAVVPELKAEVLREALISMLGSLLGCWMLLAYLLWLVRHFVRFRNEEG